MFGFEEDAYNTIESAGSLEVCVTARDGVLEAQFQFALRTTSGSASGNYGTSSEHKYSNNGEQ